ncbi:MAG: DUF4377 domain-containing protein [Bacteroidales bacterium]
MKHLKLLFAAALSMVIIASCATKNSTQKENIERMEINSQLIDCMGVAPMKCMQVKYLDRTGEDKENWNTMYGGIEGFEYEPGYVYVLEVEKEVLDPKTVPADASTIRYKLVKVISKEAAK